MALIQWLTTSRLGADNMVFVSSVGSQRYTNLGWLLEFTMISLLELGWGASVKGGSSK